MIATPGPWEAFTIMSTLGTSYRIFRDGEPAVDIAHIPMDWAGDGSNARLIAAAPDLLALLREYAGAARHAGARAMTTLRDVVAVLWALVGMALCVAALVWIYHGLGVLVGGE
jgi:hypothetical protein